MGGSVTDTTAPDFPDAATVGHDLGPTNGDGDLVIHEPVARGQALVVAGNSTDGNDWSASVRWIDDRDDDNEFVSEAKTDTELNAVSNDWARLVRKGPVAEVTFTSEESDGTANNLNAYLDTHR